MRLTGQIRQAFYSFGFVINCFSEVIFIMMTTLEVIYENGIFKPLSSVPKTLREHERMKIVIESQFDESLESEIAQWEQASDEDFLKFEQILEEKP